MWKLIKKLIIKYSPFQIYTDTHFDTFFQGSVSNIAKFPSYGQSLSISGPSQAKLFHHNRIIALSFLENNG